MQPDLSWQEAHPCLRALVPAPVMPGLSCAGQPELAVPELDVRHARNRFLEHVDRVLFVAALVPEAELQQPGQRA